MRRRQNDTQEKAGRRLACLTYIGAITIPFRDFSFVLKTMVVERGPTGLREAVVLDMMIQKGAVEIGSPEKTAGWSADPYDASFSPDFLRNLSEDRQYDTMFPDHPLSRVRSILDLLEEKTTIADEAKTAPKFGSEMSIGQRVWHLLAGRRRA